MSATPRSNVKAPSAKQHQPATQPANAKPQTFLVGELAQRWRVSDTHIAGFIDEGRLRAIDLAGKGASRRCLRVPLEEVERFEQNNSTTPPFQPGRKP